MENDRSNNLRLCGGGPHRCIFDHIVSVENLFAAWKEFKKNKNKKIDVISFSLNLENNIFNLRDELVSGNWVCSGYKKFSIRDPNEIFDETFIFDCYSSRNGKGTHAGVKRLEIFLRKLSSNYTKPVYALKCDIRKFFDSIDHEMLLDVLKQKINCPETPSLLGKIIYSFHKIPGKGLPLGNVTSQIFANIYMNSFDWYVKRELRIKYYVRYCDDFIILSSSHVELIELLPLLRDFLRNNLKLELHQDKVIIRKFHQGVDFLGAVLLPHRTLMRTNTQRRMVRRSYRILKQVEICKLSKIEARQILMSYLGHASHVKSRSIRNIILNTLIKIRNLVFT